MEWLDLQGGAGAFGGGGGVSYSPLEETLFGFCSPPPAVVVGHNPSPASSDWTYEENKLFEDALAEFDVHSPDFFDNVASRVPWKTVDAVKKHYEELVEDVELIESGQYPVPDYTDNYYTGGYVTEDESNDNENELIDQIQVQAGGSSSAGNGNGNGRRQRRRGVPWTEEEHQLFLMGLNKYGKGDWRSISRYYVITKTPTQVASHAQKYFRRQLSLTPADRRRPSIHDIQTVNSIPVNNAIAAAPALNMNMNTSYMNMSINAGYMNMNSNTSYMNNNNNNMMTADGMMGTNNNLVLDAPPAAAIPNYSAPEMFAPNSYGAGGSGIDQNPMPMPMPMPNYYSAFPSDPAPTADFMNYQNAAASYYFLSFGNNQQPWP